MSDQFAFADRLSHYVARTAYTPGQLSALADLPKSTIVNWLQGRVSRPREWQALVRLLTVLHLSEKEADDVLQAAGKPPVAELRRAATAAERPMLDQWQHRPERTQVPVPFQAIPDPPYFVGREQALEQLMQWLQEGEMCVIQGLPGVGKTALAARLAYRLRERLTDGVLWARPASSDPASILGTFARAYGVDVSDLPDVDSRGRVVRNLLADKRALLVLDDVPDSQSAEPLLPPTGRCAVLLTTRRQNLRVGLGARRLTLAPFAVGGDSARRLFAEILGEERVAAEAALFDQIAALLGQLPLALLLVACRLAYEPGWSTSALLARLQQQSRRLEAVAYEDLSLRLSFALSLEGLPATQRRFFALLSVFPGEDFTAEAAAAVAAVAQEEAENDLRTLHARSLIQPGRAGRYTLHPLLRDFAGALLVEEGEHAGENAQEQAQRRLVAYFRRFLDEAGNGQSAAIWTIAAEEANILGTLEIARSLGEQATYARMVLDLAPYLAQRGFLVLAEQQLQQALPLLAGAPAAECRLHLATIARHQRRYQEAEAHLDAAQVTVSGTAGTWPAIHAGVLTERAIIAACRHDYRQAATLFEEALPPARQSDTPDLLVRLLKEWGATEVALGHYESAAGRYAEALALARAQVPVQVPALLRALGGLAVAGERDYEQARAHYRAAIAEADAFEGYPALPILLNNLAVTAAATDEPVEAKGLLVEALALARQRGEPVTLAAILLNLGTLALQQGERDAAERCLEEALVQAEQAAHPDFRQRARATLAHLQQNSPGAPPQLTIIFD